MATLTQVATQTKKYTAFAVVGLISLLVLRIVVGIFGLVGSVINSNVPIHADNGFGQLPNISVNPITYTQSKGAAQFVINTTNGGFPQEPSLSDVYKFKPTTVSLLSTDNAQKTARSFGFADLPVKLSDSIYEWKAGQKDFIYNIKTDQFRVVNNDAYDQIQSDITNANKFGGALSITQDGINSAAAGIMQNLPVGTDFTGQKPILIYLNYATGGAVTRVADSTTANAVRVIYLRSYKYLQLNATRSISNDQLYLLSDNPLAGNVSFTIDSDQANMTSGLIDLNFSNWPVDTSSFSTYTIKSPQQAWQDVQTGNAYLVYLVKSSDNPYGVYTPLDVSKFEAEKITLSYFDGIHQQDFLEPIYVIQGTAILTDGSSAIFYFYDPAII